jgi:hypothetical protein
MWDVPFEERFPSVIDVEENFIRRADQSDPQQEGGPSPHTSSRPLAAVLDRRKGHCRSDPTDFIGGFARPVTEEVTPLTIGFVDQPTFGTYRKLMRYLGYAPGATGDGKSLFGAQR